MAISKEILNNKKNVKSTNVPKPLGNVPENNPEHVSGPVDFHHPIPPKPILYNSFEEAVEACEQIFLKPGEAHTEFYQKGEAYHCVVAIGNIKPDTKHLYLTDSGNEMSIDDRLDNMLAQVTNLSKQFSLLSKKFDDLNDNIEEFENNVSTALNNIRIDITNFENNIKQQINQVNTSINIFSEKIEDISNYVDSFDNRIQQNTDNISDLSTRAREIENWKLTIDNSVNQLELKSNQLDSSIIELHNLINKFEPIDSSSIRSLFHDDIWTVNLCCYTAGGHIEIFDDVAGEKCGGDSLRVAECTPFNEYKTYVEGDDVSFMAVANEGYKFVKWFYGDGHNIVDYADTSIINLEFGQSDIPVIGTLGENANPSEPAILLSGYSAFFRKLHEVKWSIDTSCNTTQHLIEYFDDKIKVKITEKDRTSKEYIIDNNFTGKIYFDDDAKVEITALPSENGRHTFEYYVLNDSPEKIYNNSIIITDAKDDIIVDTYFKEWWINIQTQPRPNVADIYVPEGSDMYHLREDILHVNIENVQEGWQFKKWADVSISDIELEKYIIEGDLTTPDITVQVDASISSGKYDLIANFGINQYNVTFYIDGKLEKDINVDYNTPFNTIEKPEHTKQEYVFLGWENAKTGELWQDDDTNPIVEDSMFDASYQKIQPHIVVATFVDWDGSVLYVEELNAGNIPEYHGITPTRNDEYDPKINHGTEFIFNGWDPEIEAIYEDTTYTAIYITHQFEYVNKFIRENVDNISSEKDYLLLSAVTNDNFNIAYNMDFNASSFYLNSTKAYVEPFTSFEELKEFEIPQNADQPLAYINIYENNGEKYLYIKDLRPEYEGNISYNGYLAANTTGNKFTALYKTINEVPNNGEWTIDSSSIINKSTNKSIRYNSDTPRFSVYGSTTAIKDFAKLYYKETYKKYSNLLFSTYNQNILPKVINSKYIIATDD